MLPSEITHFKLNDIKHGDNIVIIGDAGSGKTNIIKNILGANRDCHAIVVSPSERHNHNYTDNATDDSSAIAVEIYAEYTPYLGSHILQSQKKAPKKPLFFILEDCDYIINNWLADEYLKSILATGRFLGITTIISMQSTIPHTFKNEVAWLFILSQHSPLQQYSLFNNSPCAVFKSFEIFQQVMEEKTQDYNCLVFNTFKDGCSQFKSSLSPNQKLSFRVIAKYF